MKKRLEELENNKQQLELKEIKSYDARIVDVLLSLIFIDGQFGNKEVGKRIIK